MFPRVCTLFFCSFKVFILVEFCTLPHLFRRHMVLVPAPLGWRLLSVSCTNTGMMRHFLCSQVMHKDGPLMCSLMDLLRLFSFPSCPHKGSTTNHFHSSCRNVLILGVHKFPVFHSWAFCSSGLVCFLLSWVWKRWIFSRVFLSCKVSHEKLIF